jgi:lipopolysaccharide transport system permease protein
LLPWTFFSSAISFAVPSLVGNMSLVTKIYFPREILPMASVAASFIDFLIACALFVVMIIIYGVPIGINLVLFPLLVAIQIILTLGIVLAASAMMVTFRDIRFLIPLGLQLWMYATPIIYPLSLVPERWRSLYLLNPMAGLIDSYRRIVLTTQWPDLPSLASAAGISLALFLVAYRYFKGAEAAFADII